MVKSDVGRSLFTMGRCGATPHELSSPCSSESAMIGSPAPSASNPPTMIMVRGMGKAEAPMEGASSRAKRYAWKVPGCSSTPSIRLVPSRCPMFCGVTSVLDSRPEGTVRPARSGLQVIGHQSSVTKGVGLVSQYKGDIRGRHAS